MRLSMYHGTDVDKHVGRLCKAGYGEACASVARLLRLQRKIKQANQTYRKACRHSKHKSLYACATWGLMFVGRWSAAIRLLDKRKGCSLFIETCEKGYSKGCSYVNQYDCLPQRIRVPRQSTHKEPFQDNILRVRLNARALFQLAEFVRYRRSDRAVEQYVFACRKHSADACRRVHAHHTWRRNAPVALRFLKKACRLHSPDSCRKLAGIYLGRYRSQGYTEVKSKRIACLAFHMAAAARRTRKLNPWYEGRLLRKYKCPPPP